MTPIREIMSVAGIVSDSWQNAKLATVINNIVDRAEELRKELEPYQVEPLTAPHQQSR